MLITVQQTKSNFENLFEISCEGQVLFNAKAPWMKMSVPFNLENVRQLTFSGPTGERLYTTNYRMIDNLLEEAVPFKYLITKEQKFGQFEIIGNNGREGTFYTLQNGLFDCKFCIEHMGKVYLGYSIDRGGRNVVSIYEDEMQIAQITKPLAVIDNLDIYFLHIKEEYASMIPVLSFFIIFYDYRKYNNSGQIVKHSVEVTNSYSYSKNNCKYNSGWISREFGQQASEEFEQILKKLGKDGTAEVKRVAKIVGIVFLGIIFLAAILLIVIINIIT